ncbi:hypothetical protein EYF80_024250 [Liparis tanakae]|uniref:Uncharacterized protein n=1 Tax=Liparis tanakae TaxID=230148 RepID=A0A4Z2HLB5_9TELE|nr:hypothetical protein EYF80_024250 [Liparis tanakae]
MERKQQRRRREREKGKREPEGESTPLGSMPVGVSPFRVNTFSLSSLRDRGAYPASCASCALMIDSRLLVWRNSHTAGTTRTTSTTSTTSTARRPPPHVRTPSKARRPQTDVCVPLGAPLRSSWSAAPFLLERRSVPLGAGGGGTERLPVACY